MRFLFIMDPAETMLPDRDTSFALMRGALAAGHACWHCEPLDLHHHGREVQARCRTVVVADPTESGGLGLAPVPAVTVGPSSPQLLGGFDAIFVRKDPPFDVQYLHLTQQLDLVRDETLIINDPRGLRDANEKLFAFHFSEFMPRSLVTSRPDEVHAFLEHVGGRAVLKPLDGAGGSGVVTIARTDPNTRALVELWTREGRQHTLVQEYLPAIRQGDKRVLMLDGAPLGAILRVPQPDDNRANIHVGGQVDATTLDATEEELVARVGMKLRQHGLWFVGLDLIGGRLIEVNVTSPTGIQELGRLSGTRPEATIISWVEQRVRERTTG